MKTALTALVVALAAGPCFAQEPIGCDKFKWPLDKERATLTGTGLPKVASGDRISWPIPFATTVGLVPFANAKLPTAPERAPKSPSSFGGFVQISAPARAATYKITLSSEGWIDVIQDGHAIKSSAFSGATGCEGVRKSAKFPLAAQPFTVKLSGVPASTIGIAITGE
jgi:hypothetical protein